MAQRYALVDANGVTQNIILWDGVTSFVPPPGLTAVPEAQAQPFSLTPIQPSVITKSAFLARFTSAEMTLISGAARANDTVNVWLITAQAAEAIDLTNPETKAGLDALVAAGLITGARETQILTP